MLKDKALFVNPHWKKVWPLLLTCSIAVLALLVLATAIASAAGVSERTAADQAEYAPKPELIPASRESRPSIAAQPAETTTLTLHIVSSPWAVRDHNWTPSSSEVVPRVFVVEAVITNTGTTTATNVVVNLDYNEDPASGWVLLSGESPTRTIRQLTRDDSYHAYWFARFSMAEPATHQYTITAFADNASLVATPDNYYGNPEPDATVKTRSFQSTGNSNTVETTVDIVVGLAFTVTVDYDLGQNPQETIFSPVGNLDFDASAYRLLGSTVRFYSDDDPPQESIIAERLYFNTLPGFADHAAVNYTFIAIRPVNTRLCSYTGIGYQSTDKYDNEFCTGTRIIPITGTVALSLTKHASASVIEQNQLLTYTVYYTNNSGAGLAYAWVWDDIDPALGSIVAGSLFPPGDPVETTDHRAAWYLGNIGPYEANTLTFTIRIDGGGQDLADGANIVNHASFGINQDSVPAQAALTSTFTTTILAPTISVAKTDGRATAETGDALVYTLRITNSGSVTATRLVITDQLPAFVSYAPDMASPPETGMTDQTLIWDNLGPIPPGGEPVVITIPITVNARVPNGTILSNISTVKYENPAGWVYIHATAEDTTTVTAPVLTISKSDFPDPVLSGHLITYSVYYANDGPVSATNVMITDVVPLSTTYQTCSPAPCGMSSGVVSWTIGTVPADAEATVSFSVQVTDTLETGTLIQNDDYGIVSDQTQFVTGSPETTTVNRDAAFVEGYTYVDADGDGEYDPTENALSGISVVLPGARTPITSTNGSGYYRFRIEIQQPISVTAALPADYFHTTPGTVYLDSVLGVTQTVNFGYAPITSTFGVIYGTVFEDMDHDGTQDVGENGLQGVTVTSTQAVTLSVTTDPLGQYTLRFNTAGSVTITESDPDFYVSTTANQVLADAEIGSSGPSPINFGDFRGVRITGQVFDDGNVNGINDDGTFIQNAIVAAGSDSFVTGSSGVYTLYVTVVGSSPILISETDPDGYVSTNSVPGTGMERVDANTLRIPSPISGTVYTDGDFGDVLASGVITVSGQVWDDNGEGGGGQANGLRDGTEPGLAGAVVGLSSGITQTTGSDGSFQLYALPGEVITVTETDPTNYVSTNAIPGYQATKLDNNTLIVSRLGSGETSADNLFGDTMIGSAAVITGTVFDDANANGVMDLGELGFAGVTVTLEFADGYTNSVTTDMGGDYQFAVAPGTDVRITSSGPGGVYYPTTPESFITRPPAAGLYPNNNFGYSDVAGRAVIFGLVFDDANSNGEPDFGELGLAGAVITLEGFEPITTTGDGLITGTFTFSVMQTDVYSLHETNPPGYRSTTSDDININVSSLDRSYYVDFGDTDDTGTATIYGTVFNDLNGDGVRDPDEIGLPGVVISVTVSEGVITTTTEAYGQYQFSLTEGGYHTVSEQDPALPGYHSTTPDDVNVFTSIGNSHRVDFGDTDSSATSSITGIVFNDLSGEGVQDPSEPGLQGVLISLSSGLTTTTGINGIYTFAITETGYIRVIETDPDGFHSTTPNTVGVNVATFGQVYRVNFGDTSNTSSASFFGTVFEDLNANGAWDLIEPPLSDVSLRISGAALPVVTNEWGQFTFLIESAGTYTVSESDPVDYVSTNAIPGDPAVVKIDNNTLRASVSLGTDLGDNLFGDVRASEVITISGLVWDDNGAGGGISGDGERNGAEPGLAGAIVSLSSGMVQTTGPDGTFLLYAPPTQEITLQETDPFAYRSTNAIPGNDAVRIDENTLLVQDTLTAGATSGNNLFGDVLLPGCHCPGDGYEDDDLPADATPLQIGYANGQAHNFCDDAIDWVKFTVEATQIYTLTTSSWGQRADTFLALFDTDGQTLLAANDDYAGTTDFSSRIVWQAPAGGEYYLRITNRANLAGCNTDYTVWIEHQEQFFLFLPFTTSDYQAPRASHADGVVDLSGIIRHSCMDVYETDDTWQEASSIQAGVPQIHSFDSDPEDYAADKDFVWFNASSGETVTFTIALITNTQTLLELYHESGDALGISGTSQLVWTPASDGRYYLSVSPLMTTFGCADQAGYILIMEEPAKHLIYLPLMEKGL